MRNRLGVWVVVLMGLFACGARAQQVDVTLTLAYNAFVVGEPVLVQVELLNATRDLIDVGSTGSPDRLLLDMTRNGQYNVVEPSGTAPFAGAFQLKPGQVFKQKLELDKWFPMLQEGRYMVQLVLVHGGLRYESVKKSLDVVPGLSAQSGVQMFVDRQDLKRTFKLVYWHRNQTDRLFLRTEDAPGQKVWDSIDLGGLMRSTPPKLDIAPDGEITILHRATQDSYIRTVLWSLPDSLEVVERNSLLDPDISASKRVKTLYGEMAAEGGEKKESRPFWKFW